MIKRFSFKNRALLLLTLPVLLSACSGEQKPAEGTPEALLAAEGEWSLVEERQAPSPQQKHMNSRLQVNPAQTQGHNAYTKTVEESPANEDVHFRVLRLERQMDALQGNFDKIIPPLAGRANADRDLSRAAEEIQASRQNEMAAANLAAPKKPEAKLSAVKPVAAKPAIGGALTVSGLRVGDHPGKTRLVLDLNGSSKFTADLDPAENILVIELPGAGWSAAAQKSFGNHPLLKAYSTQSANGSTRLVIELKKAAKLGMKTAMAPNATYANHRIVLDLVP
jgi:hypothetical protein